MPHRTFLTFIWPSALAMLLFIALPIVSVAVQSLYVEHEQVVETVRNCGPFGCKDVEVVNSAAAAQLTAHVSEPTCKKRPPVRAARSANCHERRPRVAKPS